jgi:hypothetical protein
MRAAGPLPRWVSPAPESLDEGQRADGLVPRELLDHTTTQGTQTFFAFNEWLTTQVADIIEAAEASSQR